MGIGLVNEVDYTKEKVDLLEIVGIGEMEQLILPKRQDFGEKSWYGEVNGEGNTQTIEINCIKHFLIRIALAHVNQCYFHNSVDLKIVDLSSVFSDFSCHRITITQNKIYL